MALNNGNIPTYQQQAGYTATINPTVPQGSPAAFGTTVAKEQAGFYENLAKLGDTLAQHAIKLQQQEDDNNVLIAANSIKQQVMDRMYNSTDGYMNRHQTQVYGMTKEFTDWSNETLDKVMGEMKSEDMRAKLLQSVSPFMQQTRTSIARHEGDERYTAGVNTLNADYQADSNFAVENGTLAGMHFLFSTHDMRLAQYQQMTGASKESAEAWWRDQFSKTSVSMAQMFEQGGNSQSLLDLAEFVHGKVDAQTESLIAAKSGTTRNRQEVASKVTEWINSGEYTNSDGMTYNKGELRERAFKEFGPGAGHWEYSAGGGSGSYFGTDIDSMIVSAAEKYHVDPSLVAAVAMQESKGKQDQVSYRGAIGVMQIIPDTAAHLGIDPYNKQQNIEGGAKYLRELLDTFGGDETLALAAYNAGPGAVKDHNGVPPYEETQNYINLVLGYKKDFSTSQAEPNLGDVVTLNNNSVNIDNLDKLTARKVALLAKQVQDKYGFKLNLSEGWADGRGHDDGSWHYSGQAVDIAQDELTNPEVRHDVIRMGAELGLIPLDEYETRSANWTGDHIHFSDHGDPIPEGKGATRRWVSTDNPKMLEMSYAEIDRVCGNKESSTNEFYNRIIAELSKQSFSSETEIREAALAKGAPVGMVSTIVSRVYGNNLGIQRRDKNYNEEQEKKAARDARKEVYQYLWSNKDKELTTFEVDKTLENLSNLDPETAYTMRRALLGSSNGTVKKWAWFNNAETKYAFENVVGNPEDPIKGPRRTYTMEYVQKKVDEKRRNHPDEPPTPYEISAWAEEANREVVIKKGLFFDEKGRPNDSPSGIAGQDVNGVKIDSNGNTGLDEDDME